MTAVAMRRGRPAAAVVHRVDVEPWLLAHNDDAVAGGLLINAGCTACQQYRRLVLKVGAWSLEHAHGAPWAARMLAVEAPGAVHDDHAAALAAGIAEAFLS